MNKNAVLALSVAALAVASSAQAGGLKVLYLQPQNSMYSNGTLNDLIGSDSRFDLANSQLRTDLPSVSDMLKFDVVMAGANFQPLPGTGDRLADYVDAGGHLVMTTFTGYWQSAGYGGRIFGHGYSPLTGGTNDAYNSVALGTYDATSPYFAGVGSLTSTMYNGDYTGVDSGATLLGSWSNGRPLLAVNAAHNVADLTLFPDVAQFGNAGGDYRRLFANTLAETSGFGTGSSAPVPEPASFAALGVGLLALARRRSKLA